MLIKNNAVSFREMNKRGTPRGRTLYVILDGVLGYARLISKFVSFFFVFMDNGVVVPFSSKFKRNCLMKEIFLYRKTIHHTVSLFLTRNYIPHDY